MSIQRLSTNLNCASCVARVTPQLDRLAGAGTWSVDTAVPEKVLTVRSDIPAAQIVDALESVGFTATPLS